MDRRRASRIGRRHAGGRIPPRLRTRGRPVAGGRRSALTGRRQDHPAGRPARRPCHQSRPLWHRAAARDGLRRAPRRPARTGRAASDLASTGTACRATAGSSPADGRGDLCGARPAAHRAGAARDRQGGATRAEGKAAGAGDPGRPPGRAARPYDGVGRLRQPRGHGGSHATKRLRLPRPHRAFAVSALCRGPDGEGGRQATARDRPPQQALRQRLPRLQGNRIGHPRGRLARLPGRGAGQLRPGHRQHSQQVPARAARSRRTGSSRPSRTRTRPSWDMSPGGS